MRVQQFLREDISAMDPYSPAPLTCDLDLSDNTNLWGAPPSARTAIQELNEGTLSRYPASNARTLRVALAAYIGVAPEWIVTGCGSDDILDSAIRAFATCGDRIAIPDPSFSMVTAFARVNAVSPMLFPLTPAFSPDVEAMVGSGARLLYLCSPNNPTGGVLSIAAIEAVVRKFPGIVILDEAYTEFSGATAVSLLKAYDNLVITRTLSKAFGLAGLRIGFAVCSPMLAREIEKCRGPYKINAVAEAVGVAVLTNDMAWVAGRALDVQTSRDRLTKELKLLGYSPQDSQANFVLVPVNDAAELSATLCARGISVRAFRDLTGIGDAVRMTVGPWQAMQQLLDALAGISR